MKENPQPQNSPSRARPIQKNIRFSEEEWNFIMEKVRQSGLDTYSEYIREMALKGYVIEIDYSAVKALMEKVWHGQISILLKLLHHQKHLLL